MKKPKFGSDAKIILCVAGDVICFGIVTVYHLRAREFESAVSSLLVICLTVVVGIVVMIMTRLQRANQNLVKHSVEVTKSAREILDTNTRLHNALVARYGQEIEKQLKPTAQQSTWN